MATTTGGTPYVTSTDLVAAYPTSSLSLANRVDVVASGSTVYNTANYTVTVANILSGATIIQDSASATTVTLPSSSLVDGMQAKISNVGAGTVTVAGGTLIGTTTINQYGGITAVYKASITSWWLLPFSGSVGAANFSNTATGTYTGYKYVTFTGNGTLTIDRAGFADLLVIGGGDGSGYSMSAGGGAGGHFSVTNAYLPVGSLTITLGGGGAGSTTVARPGTMGSPSAAHVYRVIGGGGGGSSDTSANGTSGGSGGGSATAGAAVGTAGSAYFAGEGNAGGTGSTDNATYRNGGGGGGGSAAGGNSVHPNAGAGGAGSSSSITGTAVTRAGGGGGGALNGTAGTGGAGGGGAGSVGGVGTAGTVNTGGGAGGSGQNTNGAAGGSGIVIVRVAV